MLECHRMLECWNAGMLECHRMPGMPGMPGMPVECLECQNANYNE